MYHYPSFSKGQAHKVHFRYAGLKYENLKDEPKVDIKGIECVRRSPLLVLYMYVSLKKYNFFLAGAGMDLL